MVVPCGIAAAGSAGATALGLGMGATDLDLTHNLFKKQMRQAKRLWTADWAEASIRHGEQCTQSAQQHAEAQAMATATYFQAEKLASQSMKLARDQDSRSYEMSWRAEARESLRDELANQNNRFNIIMLCDTVCLSCVFSLVADGSPPVETPMIMLNVYVFFLGLSIMLFTISLWCSVIVVRRLHEHTASILERKLFAQSEDLQKVWHHQLSKNLPTGPHEMYLVNQAYEKWVAEYLNPIGNCSIHMLSIGVVAMFITAGLLTHNRYLIEFNARTAVPIFWSTVLITSTILLLMKYSEDRKEKKKEGVYDISWQDLSTVERGPYAKINRVAEELFSNTAVGLGSVERMESLSSREQMERDFCAKTRSLHHRVQSLRQASEQRVKTRKDVLQLLTTAAEELDALPEELTSQLNKMLHDIDEADRRTASLIAMQSESMLAIKGSRADWSRLRMTPTRREAMAPHPIDAQRIPVSLGLLRKKLGEVSHTTLLRLKNLSDEPLRLKSGVQLKEGRYMKSLRASDPDGQSVCHHLYPVTEIPPRTEVVVAARSGGRWVPTSGIDGEIVYTNRDESWVFRISFRNELLRNVRRCQVQASHVGEPGDLAEEIAADEYWQISKDELDRKANNEVVISIDVLRGAAAHDYRQSHLSLKEGFLLKNKPIGMRMKWQQKWFVLTPTEIIYSQDIACEKKSKIAIKDILGILRCSDMVKKNVFQIHTRIPGREPYKLSAASPEERDDWIRKIMGATGIDLTDSEAYPSSEDSTINDLKDGVEVVHSDRGTEVLPV